ncbi:aldo/keto reductase [Clavulina sp. PMI_390]|nr:aldo/keto reductase [Clavulina sp. PMI_390]
MSFPTTPFGNSGVQVAGIAHGLMMMTMKNPPLEDEDCFNAMKASLDLVSPPNKVIFNSAEFYGLKNPSDGLTLLQRFFDKYPEYADRALLCVKGGINMAKHGPDSSPEFIRTSVGNIQKLLGSNKKLDHFECGRMDGKHPIEEVIGTLKELVDEGQIKYIGVSEVSGATLRRAVKVAPIASLEIEVSPWAYDDAVKEAIAAAGELGVVVLAYSPLGRGFLAGNMSPETVAKDDRRRIFPRFADDMMVKNKKIVDAISALAKKKGITNAELCIAWVRSLGPHVIPMPGSNTATRVKENFSAVEITFTPEEKKEIDEVVAMAQSTVSGDRYAEVYKPYLMISVMNESRRYDSNGDVAEA